MTEKYQLRGEQEPRAGMEVEASEGDLGEADVSRPVIEQVVRDAQGQVDHLVIQKGVLFRKKLSIPANRIERVETPQNSDEGKVLLQISEQEAQDLTGQGSETLEPVDDLLGNVEEQLPTAEGLRRWERRRAARKGTGSEPPARPVTASWLHLLGPGFLSGMAGNDASAVGAYSVDGAQVGYQHLWLMVVATPLYQSVQYTCAKIGRITGKGMAEVLRTHYNRPVAACAALVLVLANIALMTADLVAISSGIELLTGLSWIWFVVPVAAFVWYITVYQSFDLIKKVFIGMSLVFLVYGVTAVLSHPDGRALLLNTFVPHVSLSFESISSAVALLGATISPYTMYWQVQGEKEEQRPGKTQRQQIRFAALDIVLGAVGGNLIAYCIMVTAAATLFAHHKSITTVVDAAAALAPLLGPFAKYLFAIGFIGAGLVALPVLLASTSYAVAGTVGWPGGLAKKPWQNEGFYLILSGALLVSLILAFVRIDPIHLLFWANVLNGVLSPILVFFLFLVGNSRKVMRDQRLSWLTNCGLILTFLLMSAAAVLLFYGLLTGSG
ncbi:MAG TPA: Nramp family divalent metal transporter [Ktedonobacteraceae bacterium]|nr:Nramp family divalent metal transporter [Ktedonobacteraceae bacterium]